MIFNKNSSHSSYPEDGRGFGSAAKATREEAALYTLRKIFSEIPGRYESTNRVLTFGLDSIWRKKASREAVVSFGNRFLDVCTGTAQTAFCIAREIEPDAIVVGIDFSLPMMLEGARKRGMERVFFVAASAWELPFCDESFDSVTISFAARNLAISRESLVTAYAEMRRVLKRGGLLVNLESSQPPSRLVRSAFHFYARAAVPLLGRIFSGGSRGYDYLSNTLCSFFGARQLDEILIEAGFSEARHRFLALGTIALHTAIR